MSEHVVRTYGGWRRPRVAGMGKFSLLSTVVLMGGLGLVVIANTVFGWQAGLATLAVGGLVLWVVTVKDKHGLSLLNRAMTRVGWFRAQAAGSTTYRSGGLGAAKWGTCQLPGVLAGSELGRGRDPWGREFALIHHTSVNHYSVVFASRPDGESLVDQDQVDRWVALWGQWLASLGNDPAIKGASVTVETAPDMGLRLRREVLGHVADDAPELAAQTMRELVASLPSGAADVRAWVSVTWSGTNGGRRMTHDQVMEMIRPKITSLSASLAATGAGAVVPVSPEAMCELMRCAYDPAASMLFEAARSEGEQVDVEWSDCGPQSAVEAWDHYTHDSAVSKTWEMTGAPEGLVQSRVLRVLLAPHPKVAIKRVTLLYRPVDVGRTGMIVQADVRNARVRATSSRTPDERALAELNNVKASEREEARGAGLETFSLLVTATSLGRDVEWNELDELVEALGWSARIRLRPVYGGQAAAFACGLPAGLVPSAVTNTPAVLRSWGA